MPYVKTINEDGVVSDIMAKALDPTLDATLLHKTELENDLTQTTAGINALDAAQGKVLNDAISTLDGAVVKKADLANGFTQTTTKQKALDAVAGKTLYDKIGGFCTFGFTLSGGASQQLTVANDARFAIIFSGRYTTHQGMAIFGSNTSGAVTETDIHIPTNVSFTTATNKLTVTNGHQSNTARCLVIMLSDTPTVSISS